MPKEIPHEILVQTQEAEKQERINRIMSLTPPTETPTMTATMTETPIPAATETPTLGPTATWVHHDAGSADVFILYYKKIAKDRNDDPYYQWESPSFVPPLEFEQQVRMLYELGYNSVTISDVVKVLREGGDLPDKPVMFTFDSTEPGEYKNAYPILKRYGFVGNLFVQYNHIDAKQSMTSAQIKEMIADGWEIGSAGYYGNGMENGMGTMGQEIGESKSAIGKLLDTEVIAFAYPDGYTGVGGEYIARASNYGYLAAFGVENSIKLSFSDNMYLLPRYYITKGYDYGTFLQLLPWKDGNISQETMEWSVPTPTLDPEVKLMTQEAARAEALKNLQ